MNPKLKTLHKLAVGLDMTVSELLYFSEMNETTLGDEYNHRALICTVSNGIPLTFILFDSIL